MFFRYLVTQNMPPTSVTICKIRKTYRFDTIVDCYKPGQPEVEYHPVSAGHGSIFNERAVTVLSSVFFRHLRAQREEEDSYWEGLTAYEVFGFHLKQEIWGVF